MENLNFERGGTVSFFETVIRILGGLASAADLSGDARLATKAADLADRLLPAFQSAPTGARRQRAAVLSCGRCTRLWAGAAGRRAWRHRTRARCSALVCLSS